MARSTPDQGWHRVTKAWTATYTPALAVKHGEQLRFGHTDPDNPGWRWAENPDGLGGWLPISLIEGDHLTKDFDSAELTVAVGEKVNILETLAGWYRCCSEDGRTGWLPVSCVDVTTGHP